MGLDWQLLIFLISHFNTKRSFSITQSIIELMQVLDSNFVECWKQQYWAPLSWGSMEFSTFLVFAVWTASMTDLTFGKGELQNANHFLPLYSCFSPCYLISYHSLFVFRWFTTVDALSNEKTKNLNSTNMTTKGRNLTLENLFCKHWMVF